MQDNNLLVKIIDEVVVPKFKKQEEDINSLRESEIQLVEQVATLAEEVSFLAKDVSDSEEDIADRAILSYGTALNEIKQQVIDIEETLKVIKEETLKVIKEENKKEASKDTAGEYSRVLDSLDELQVKISLLENKEVFIYDDTTIKIEHDELLNKLADLQKEVTNNALSSLNIDGVIKSINSKEDIIEMSSIKGLLDILNRLSTKNNNNQVKVSGSILEILSGGVSILQGATRLNFTGGTVTSTGGAINIPIGGSGITRSINNVSTNTTAGSSLVTDYVYNVSNGASILMPTAVGNTNRYSIKNTGYGIVNITFTGAETADSQSVVSILPNVSIDLISNGMTWGIY